MCAQTKTLTPRMNKKKNIERKNRYFLQNGQWSMSVCRLNSNNKHTRVFFKQEKKTLDFHTHIHNKQTMIMAIDQVEHMASMVNVDI